MSRKTFGVSLRTRWIKSWNAPQRPGIWNWTRWTKELERLDAEREAKEEKLELEEKTLAVQEAQAALANAQNERTIRTYNAASGQWEWVADADAVKDAEDALKDAQEDLEDYKEDLEYQAGGGCHRGAAERR